LVEQRNGGGSVSSFEHAAKLLAHTRPTAGELGIK